MKGIQIGKEESVQEFWYDFNTLKSPNNPLENSQASQSLSAK